jgi:hypothetical protein
MAALSVLIVTAQNIPDFLVRTKTGSNGQKTSACSMLHNWVSSGMDVPWRRHAVNPLQHDSLWGWWSSQPTFKTPPSRCEEPLGTHSLDWILFVQKSCPCCVKLPKAARYSLLVEVRFLYSQQTDHSASQTCFTSITWIKAICSMWYLTLGIKSPSWVSSRD